MKYANKIYIFLSIDVILGFVDGHLTVLAVEMQRQHFAGTKTQIPRFLVFGVRVRLAAMPHLMKDAVSAGHEGRAFGFVWNGVRLGRNR